MHVGDWLQAISLVSVALALIVSAVQLRHVSRQTALASRTMERGAHDLRSAAVMQLSTALLAEPEVLAWHLRARGYPDWAVKDRRTLYALLRLQIHEQSYLDVAGEALDSQMYGAWAEALKRDLGDSFYQRLWPSARPMFAPAFANVVDEIVAGSVSGSPGSA